MEVSKPKMLKLSMDRLARTWVLGSVAKIALSVVSAIQLTSLTNGDLTGVTVAVLTKTLTNMAICAKMI